MTPCPVSSAESKAKCADSRAESECRLAIALGRDVTPPSGRHKLLLGFHFGQPAANLDQPALASIGLEPIDSELRYECWWYDGAVHHERVGEVRLAQCDDYAVAILQWPDAPPEEFRQSTYEAYRELLAAVDRSPHRRLVKIWNYFAGINDGEGDSERYRQFSIGRAEAFEEFGLYDQTVPTGTAIGTTGHSQFTIIALMSKRDFQSVENPRQVSAYRYPRQYGPKSPKFSRGGSIAVGQHNVYLISGTAAIIGHESAHPHATGLQLGETLTNLNRLCEAMSGTRSPLQRMSLDADCVLRVYLRNRSDLDLVAAELLALLGEIESNVVFLHANICRRELMVEIDGTRIV